MNIFSEDLAREFLEHRGARFLRTMSVEETLQVRWIVFRTIASYMESPLEFTGSIQCERLETFYWDCLPLSYPCSELKELQILCDSETQLIVMFEACRVPAMHIARASLDVRLLEGEDLYVLPMDSRWVLVMTHEAECGPYLLSVPDAALNEKERDQKWKGRRDRSDWDHGEPPLSGPIA